MFERLLLRVLVEKFGKYIDGLDEENLEIAVLAGEIRLADLHLKPSALDDLNLPVLVQYGTIGVLKIDVPWAHLSSQSVQITLEDVYLVASPLDKVHWTTTDTRDYVLLSKRRRIREAEEIKRKRKRLKLMEPGGAESESQSTWYQKLFLKVIDNVRITVRNVHLRFEDATSNPARPFALGITLRELHFISTDAEGGDLFVQRDANAVMHKVARIEELAVYANSPARVMVMDLPTEERAIRMGGMVKGDEARLHVYVLPPISPTARLEVNDRLNLAFPFKYRVAVDFSTVRIQVNRAQLEDVTMLQRSFEAMSRLALSTQLQLQHRADRPKSSVMEAPREWWKYAVRCIAVKNVQILAWHDVVDRVVSRAKYIRLFNRMYAAERATTGGGGGAADASAPLSAESQREFDDLEYTLSVDDILVFRAVAVHERGGLSKVSTPVKARVLTEGDAAAAVEEGGEGGGWWGGVRWLLGASQGEEELELTSEERSALHDAIDYHDTLALAALPPDFVIADTSCTLSHVVLALNDDAGRPLVELTTSGTYEGLLRQQSWTLSASVKELRMVDKVARSTSPFATVLQFVTPSNIGAATLTVEKTFLTAKSPATTKVRLKTQPIEVIAAWPCAHRLVRFFTLPPAVESPRSAAPVEELQLADWRQSPAAAVQPGLLDVRLDIDAPIFIIPETCDVTPGQRQEVPILIVDLGSLLFISAPEPSGGCESSASCSPPASPTLSPPRTPGSRSRRAAPVHFQRWHATFAQTQVLLTCDLKRYRRSRRRKGSDASQLHILTPTNIGAEIVLADEGWEASDSVLPRLRVVANIPRIALHLSTLQWRQVLNIAAAVPEVSTWFEASGSGGGGEKPPSRGAAIGTSSAVTVRSTHGRRALLEASVSIDELDVELVHSLLQGETADAVHTLRVGVRGASTVATWLEGHSELSVARVSMVSLQALGPKLEPLIVFDGGASGEQNALNIAYSALSKRDVRVECGRLQLEWSPDAVEAINTAVNAATMTVATMSPRRRSTVMDLSSDAVQHTKSGGDGAEYGFDAADVEPLTAFVSTRAVTVAIRSKRTDGRLAQLDVTSISCSALLLGSDVRDVELDISGVLLSHTLDSTVSSTRQHSREALVSNAGTDFYPGGVGFDVNLRCKHGEEPSAVTMSSICVLFVPAVWNKLATYITDNVMPAIGSDSSSVSVGASGSAATGSSAAQQSEALGSVALDKRVLSGVRIMLQDQLLVLLPRASSGSEAIGLRLASIAVNDPSPNALAVSIGEVEVLHFDTDAVVSRITRGPASLEFVWDSATSNASVRSTNLLLSLSQEQTRSSVAAFVYQFGLESELDSAEERSSASSVAAAAADAPVSTPSFRLDLERIEVDIEDLCCFTLAKAEAVSSTRDAGGSLLELQLGTIALRETSGCDLFGRELASAEREGDQKPQLHARVELDALGSIVKQSYIVASSDILVDTVAWGDIIAFITDAYSSAGLPNSSSDPSSTVATAMPESVAPSTFSIEATSICCALTTADRSRAAPIAAMRFDVSVEITDGGSAKETLRTTCTVHELSVTESELAPEGPEARVELLDRAVHANIECVTKRRAAAAHHRWVANCSKIGLVASERDIAVFAAAAGAALKGSSASTARNRKSAIADAGERARQSPAAARLNAGPLEGSLLFGDDVEFACTASCELAANMELAGDFSPIVQPCVVICGGYTAEENDAIVTTLAIAVAGANGDERVDRAGRIAANAIPIDLTITSLLIDWVRSAQFHMNAIETAKDASPSARRTTTSVVADPRSDARQATRIMIRIDSDIALNLAEESGLGVGSSLVDLYRIQLQRFMKLELTYWSAGEFNLDCHAGSIDIEDILYPQPHHALSSTTTALGPEDTSVAFMMRVYPGFSDIELTIYDEVVWEWNPDTMLRARGLWSVREDAKQRTGAMRAARDVVVESAASRSDGGVEATFLLTFAAPINLRLNKERQHRCLAVFASEVVTVEFKIGSAGFMDMLVVFDDIVVTDTAGRVIGSKINVGGGNEILGTRIEISYTDRPERSTVGHTHVEIGALSMRYMQNTWIELVEYISYGFVSAPFIGDVTTVEIEAEDAVLHASASASAAASVAEAPGHGAEESEGGGDKWSTFSMGAPQVHMFIPDGETASAGLLLRTSAASFTNEVSDVERIASTLGTEPDEREAGLLRSLWVMRGASVHAISGADDTPLEICTECDVYMMSEYVYPVEIEIVLQSSESADTKKAEKQAPTSRTFVTTLPRLEVHLTAEQARLAGDVFTHNLAAADEPQPGQVTFAEILKDVAIAEGRRPPKNIPDQASKTCLLCRSAFSAGLIRNRCRSCGSLVCVKCSAHLVDEMRFCDCCFPFVMEKCSTSPLLPPPTEWHGEWAAVQYPYEELHNAPTPYDFRTLFPEFSLTILDADGINFKFAFEEVDYNVSRLSRDRLLTGFVAARARISTQAADGSGDEWTILEPITIAAEETMTAAVVSAERDVEELPPQLCVRHNQLGSEISDIQVNGDHCRVVLPTGDKLSALTRYFFPPPDNDETDAVEQPSAAAEAETAITVPAAVAAEAAGGETDTGLSPITSSESASPPPSIDAPVVPDVPKVMSSVAGWEILLAQSELVVPLPSHADTPSLITKMGLLVVDMKVINGGGGISSSLGLRMSKVNTSLRMRAQGGGGGAMLIKHELVRPFSLRGTWRSEHLQFSKQFGHREQHLKLNCEDDLDITVAPIDVAILGDIVREFTGAAESSNPIAGGDAAEDGSSTSSKRAPSAAPRKQSSKFDSYIVTFNEGPLGIRLHRRRSGEIIVASMASVSSASLVLASPSPSDQGTPALIARIEEGDEVITIGRHVVHGYTTLELAELVKSSPRPLQVTLRRERGASKSQKSLSTWEAQVSLKGLGLKLMRGGSGRGQPLLLLELQEARCTGRGHGATLTDIAIPNQQLDFLATANAKFYNPRIARWEPLLEPWNFNIVLRITDPRVLSVLVTAAQRLNITVADSCFGVLAVARAVWGAKQITAPSVKQIAAPAATKRSAAPLAQKSTAGVVFAAWQLVNETGAAFQCTRDGASEPPIEVPRGCKVPLDLGRRIGTNAALQVQERSVESRRDRAASRRDSNASGEHSSPDSLSISTPGTPVQPTLKLQRRSLTIRFPSGPKRVGWAPLRALPVDLVGSYLQTLKPRERRSGAAVSAAAGTDAAASPATTSLSAMWVVSLEGGSVMLRLRSCVQFCNRSAHPLMLYLRVGRATKQHAPIEAGAVMWLPLALASCTHFAVRPAFAKGSRGPKWGNSPWLSLERSHTKVCPCPSSANAAASPDVAPTLLWLHLSVAHGDDGNVVISASAPLVLRNLLPLPVAFQLRTGHGVDVGCGSMQAVLAPGQERLVHELPMETPLTRGKTQKMKMRMRIPGHRWNAFKLLRGDAGEGDATSSDDTIELRDDRWHIGVDSKYLRQEDGMPAWTPPSGGLRISTQTVLNATDSTCQLDISCKYWFNDLSGLSDGLQFGAPCEKLSSRGGGITIDKCISPSAMQTAPVQICVRENQRRRGWINDDPLKGPHWVAPFEFGDPPQWINDDDDAVDMARIPLPDMALWRWESDWEVDKARSGNDEGWFVGSSFGNAGMSGAAGSVRQRRWVRRRIPIFRSLAPDAAGAAAEKSSASAAHADDDDGEGEAVWNWGWEGALGSRNSAEKTSSGSSTVAPLCLFHPERPSFCVRWKGSKWSSLSSLDMVGSVESVEIETTFRLIELVAAVTAPPAPFTEATKLVTLRPRFTITNATQHVLRLRELDSTVNTQLLRGRPTPYHRRIRAAVAEHAALLQTALLGSALLGSAEPVAPSAADLVIQIRPAQVDQTWHWSGAFQIDKLGETAVHIHSPSQKEGGSSSAAPPQPPLVLHIIVSNDNGSLNVLIRQQEMHFGWPLREMVLGGPKQKEKRPAAVNSAGGEWPLLPPEAALFELRNDAPCKLRYWQPGEEEHILSLLPGERIIHGWDAPTEEQVVLVQPVMQRGQQSVAGFNFQSFGDTEILIAGGLASLVGTVETDGPTRVLRFTFKHIDQRRRRRERGAIDRGTSLSPRLPWRITLEVVSEAGLGLSLISRTSDEIVYGCAEGLCLEFFFDGLFADEAEHRLQFEASIGSLQIDCHLHDTAFPVVLEPVRASQRSDFRSMREKPFVHVVICWRDHGTHVLTERLVVELQKMALRVDQALVTELMVFAHSLQAFASATSSSSAEEEEAPSRTLRDSARVALLSVHGDACTAALVNASETQFCFDRVLLRPIVVLVSFASAGGRHQQEVSMWKELTKVENAELRFGVLELRHVRSAPQAVSSLVLTRYTLELKNQWQRVLGSMDALGNPAGLLEKLGSGAVDFVFEPIMGVSLTKLRCVSTLTIEWGKDALLLSASLYVPRSISLTPPPLSLSRILVSLTLKRCTPE